MPKDMAEASEVTAIEIDRVSSRILSRLYGHHGVRTMGHTAGGANGTSYDPTNMEITAANIEKYFSHSIVDHSGKAQSQFQALIQYLQNNPANS